jgi:hypothetical protein
MGAEKQSSGSLRGWMSYPGHEREATSIFALKQDVRLLNEAVVEYTLEKPLQRLIAQRKLVARDIDWFLPHMSSEFFRPKVAQALERIGLPLPKERWFTNLAWTGNTGSAAIYIMLDELLRSGQVKPGQRLHPPYRGRACVSAMSPRKATPLSPATARRSTRSPTTARCAWSRRAAGKSRRSSPARQSTTSRAWRAKRASAAAPA